MHITWYGLSCFKLQSKDLTIITDPYGKESGLMPLRTKADIVFVSHNHSNHNNIDSIKNDPFVIDGPGEYERKGIYVKGIASFHDDKNGEELGPNTIYIIEIEGIKVCHLGDLGHPLSSKQVERIDKVDILLAPVGENTTLEVDKLMDVINEIDPRIVIPMHYKIPKVKDKLSPVGKFLSEIAQEKTKPEPKIVIKAKDLPSDETKVILLENSR